MVESARGVAGRDALMEELRAHVAEKLQELDGVIGLRQTPEGTAPYLFRGGDDLSQLVLQPRYPLASVVSLLQTRYPRGRFGIVARGCDGRGESAPVWGAALEKMRKGQQRQKRVRGPAQALSGLGFRSPGPKSA